MDQDICTAMCAFDHPNVAGHNCHFTVLNSNTCHLGTLDVETNVLANPVAGADLLLKTSNFDKLTKMFFTYFNAILLYVLGVVSDESFSTVKFPSSTSTHDIKDKYIYAAFNSISYDKESCASLCYTHTISSTACQFFILYSDTCMLGNFQSTDTYTSPQDSFTAYFNEREYTKPKYLNFQHNQM